MGNAPIHVKFLDVVGDLPEEVRPYPAKKHIPNWYKSLPSYIDGEQGQVYWNEIGINQGTATGKKCMPMLDAMTAGYIIPLTTDVKVTKDKNNGQQLFQWPDHDVLGFHPPLQMTTHPHVEKNPQHAIPKFHSPWTIVTPKGYSVLCISPLNRDSEHRLLDIVPGVVDTDTYNHPINFPFLLDPNWTGIIPAGYPMVQVIPFRRESYEMEFGGKEEYMKMGRSFRRLKMSFYNGYKDRFWSRKEYN
jgi:hypothetical protein